MIHKMFAVYDSKAEAFLPPFFLPNIAMAQRTFMQCANDPQHQFCVSAGDFTLFHLGEVELNSANFNLLDTPDNLGLAITYKDGEE